MGILDCRCPMLDDSTYQLLRHLLPRISIYAHLITGTGSDIYQRLTVHRLPSHRQSLWETQSDYIYLFKLVSRILLAAQCISRHRSITESIASKERSICNMDKSGTSKRRIAHLGLNLLREGVILIFSLGFWLYCIIAFILFVGTMVRSHSPSVLLTRVTLNLEANDIEQLLRTMLLFSLIAIVIFTTCYIVQRFVCGKRGY